MSTIPGKRLNNINIITNEIKERNNFENYENNDNQSFNQSQQV